MTAGNLLESMDMDELAHWMAFHRIENEEMDEKYGTDKPSTSPSKEITFEDISLDQKEEMMMKLYGNQD